MSKRERVETGGSGMVRSTTCYMCENKAINWKPAYGGHSTCYCLDCLSGYYPDWELDYNTLDLTKNELILAIGSIVQECDCNVRLVLQNNCKCALLKKLAALTNGVTNL